MQKFVLAIFALLLVGACNGDKTGSTGDTGGDDTAAMR